MDTTGAATEGTAEAGGGLEAGASPATLFGGAATELGGVATEIGGVDVLAGARSDEGGGVATADNELGGAGTETRDDGAPPMDEGGAFDTRSASSFKLGRR